NNYGVLIRSGSPVITENNFLYDKDYVQNTPGAVFWYVRNEGSQDISAPGNWWDGTDSAFIDTYIFDKKDDARVGTVYYEPPAEQAVSDTADALRPPVVSIQAIPGFSPNGDGSFDRTTITYSLSETAASLSVAISGNGHTYNASFTDAAHVFDGTHSITWDGADKGGVTMPEGVYDVTFTAVDIETGETTTAKGQVLIDLTPPVVSITSPSSPSTVRLALIRVEGTVSDLSPVGLFVKIGNTGATFGASTGNSIPFSGQARLDTGLNQVGVYAADGAGNAALTVLDLTYDPPLTVDNLGVTNQQDAAITGKLLDTAIDHVDVQLTGDDGTTATAAATLNWNGGNSTYTTPPFTLTRGHALIVASAHDASDTLLGTAVGDITYDPFYNQTLTHHFATGLQMIGVPLMYTLAGDHKAALGLTGGTLDLARWENINDTWGYQYYGTGANANLDQFAAGKGYWLLVDPAQYPSGLDVSANGEGVDPAKPVSIFLRAGWNQISDPYPTTIDWHATQVALSGGKAVSFDQAVQNGWLSAVLWRYDQGGYRLVSTTLEPWQGYWIDVMQDCTLTFAPPNGAGSTQARLGAQRARLATAGAAPPSPFALGRARSPLAAGLFDDAGPRGPAASWSNTLAVGASPWTASAATGGGGAWARVPQGGGGQAAQAVTIRTAGWRLPLQLQADGVDGKGADVTRRDLDNAAGVDAQAKDGFDPSLDYPKPPEMGSYVRGSFELPGAGGAFATDVRAPEAADAGCSDCSGWVWRFDVSTDLKNARLRLAWPGADQLPDDVQLRITDVASGRTIDPRTQASYAFTQPVDRPRQFVVQAWSNDGGTLSSALAYPNPADLSGPIHVAFTLGGQAQVDAGVYDATGRRIRHLSAAVLPGGAQDLLWDGRDDSGRTVANGLYFVRLSTPVASRTLRVVVLR
ncbi:MAG TPA: FlgD immunoglobulin-like domain containing protein, partial [Limnochordia bacterium]|nr:FlgD immunoglobulin-like domain containing protein [Limnochordia bacterium]